MSNTALTRILDGTGPINFLGCSVVSFTAQAGWGLDSSTLTVELVEDCQASPADRFWGRDQELIGTARFFDLRAWSSPFVFGGIITSWTENKSSSGQTFTVTMTDPKQLLSGVTVLTDSYAWQPIWYWNFYNVLAKYEYLVLHGYCQYFGTARSDQRGMNYQNILKALLMIGLQDQGDPWQRPSCVSPTKGSTTAGTSDFVIDLGLVWNPATNLFTATRTDHVPLGPDYYKVAGSETLLDLFNNICELTGRNLFIELTWDAVLQKNVIVVRCIHLVDTFAGNYDTIVNTFDGVATSLSYGKEFHNPKTRNMIFGDNVSYMNQALEFTPCFGVYERPVSVGGVLLPERYPIAPVVDANKNYLRPDGSIETSCGFWFLADITKLQAGLYQPLLAGQGSASVDPATGKRTFSPATGAPIGYAWISEADIQAALSSEAMWRTRASCGRYDKAAGKLIPDTVKNPEYSLSWHMQQNYPDMINLAGEALEKLVRLKTGQNLTLPIHDMTMNTVGGQEKAHSNQQKIADLEAIYNFVLDLAQNYYGKSYVFKMNERICAHYADPSTDAGELVYSSYPSNEGGWVDPGQNVLGLVDPYLTFFRKDDGKVECFARWNPAGNSSVQSSTTTPNYSGLLDISQISGPDYISDGEVIWMKGELEDTVYFVKDLTSATGYSPAGIINFNSPAFLKPDRNLINNLAEQALTMLYMLFQSATSEQDPPANADDFQYLISYNIINGGANYKVGDTVTFAGGQDGEAKVSQVSPDGAITKLDWVNRGTGYDPAGGPYLASFPPTGNGANIQAQGGYNPKEKYCGIPSKLFETADKPPRGDEVGYLDLNHKGIIQKAVAPDAAAIPMKSNVLVYGPFFSNNFLTNYGGVKVEQDKDLAPWKFGSFNLMVAAGDAKAQTAFDGDEVPLVISENGNLSIPGMPLYALTAQILVGGVAAGPLVNSVSVSFGSQGVSTSYDFKTFSRKFGNLTAIQTDQMKQIAQNRQKTTKYLRESFIDIANTYGKSIRTRKIRSNKQENLTRQNTTHRIFVAETYDWLPLNSGVAGAVSGTGERSVVAVEGLDKLQYEVSRNYSGKAMISLDGLFSPVSISGDGNLPRFPVLETGVLTPAKSGHRRHSINPVPPVTVSGNVLNALDLQRKYFNPLTNSFTSGSHPYHSGKGMGHNIDILARETEVPLSGTMSSMYDQNDPSRYSDDYRFVSHRGPMVLHQWGYDTQGKPVPNEADDLKSAQNGVYATGGLTERFMTDWLHKPSSWPVAPVDLRFDRSRGMWVAPPEYKIAVVEPLSGIDAYSVGSGKLINSHNGREYGNPILDSSGNAVADSDVTITIEDRIGNTLSSGQKSYAYFDTFTSTYLLMGGGGGGTSIVLGRFNSTWKKGFSAPVTVHDTHTTIIPTGTGTIESVVNLFADIPAASGWCIYMRGSSFNYLIAAECKDN